MIDINDLEQMQQRIAALEKMGEKVNAIRNSIVGMQGFNFSEHAYPLVAALNEAGFVGEDYPAARANLGTLIEQRDKLREALTQARLAMISHREYCQGRALTHAGIDRCIEMADAALKP